MAEPPHPEFTTSDGYRVSAPAHHDRRNGGHVVVVPPDNAPTLPELPMAVVTRLMEIGTIIDRTLSGRLRAEGVPVVRANYSIAGNWAYKSPDPEPYVHLHVHLRSAAERHPAGDPRFAPFPDALVLPDPGDGYYSTFEPLTADDMEALRQAIERHTDGR